MSMLVAIFFMRLFEVMFFAGVAGSAVVVVISFIEDIQLLVGEVSVRSGFCRSRVPSLTLSGKQHRLRSGFDPDRDSPRSRK